MAREKTKIDAHHWNHSIANLSGVHILQSWDWGEFKSHYGWKVIPKTWLDCDGKVIAAALVLQRSILIKGFESPFRILYVPRGPMLDWGNDELRENVLDDLEKLAHERGAIFIKVDPDVVTGLGAPGMEQERDESTGTNLIHILKDRGWRFADSQIQFRNTFWIDLRISEDDLLSRMKQKTRYNLRLAMRKGVLIRKGDESDLRDLFRMYLETSVRDNFVIRSEEYYLKLWHDFLEKDLAKILIAEVDGEMVSGLILFHFAGHAWFNYGMSIQKHRNLMPSYLIQWEAIRLARSLGCIRYDMWGAPDVFDETDPMWGVFRFKSGFGGEVVRTLGAWDYPAQKLNYSMYTRIFPKILDFMRSRGKKRARRFIN
ncbi:MAG: peptidoglycan bridge formation glycyltransferase FemA/FemB family protein [Anaerolineaceae bacterium]|nr:peptidoglycan bridge formation glycyltransferase FemA/FemB family protein [Anaerolineaceae bacterium]